MAQWLLQSGNLPQYTQWLQSQAPQSATPTAQQVPPAGTVALTPFGTSLAPNYSKEQERQMLEQQIQMLESQLESIRKRIEELNKQ